MGKKSTRVKKVKPPVAIEVSDILNLARLAMSRVDVQPLFWHFKWKNQPILGYLSSIPYWYGNLPIFAYTKLNYELKSYIAYMSVEKEEVLLTDNNDDSRYMYGAIIETEDEPPFITEALSGRNKLKDKPVLIKAGNLNSLIRMLIILSDTNSSPPLWYFEFKGKHVLGLIAPFFDYYDANALPVFFYVESDTKPPASFIRYISLKSGEEISYVPYISDMKYFYGRIVNVKSMPFFTGTSLEYRK
ncbi:MAG: hypothetical protein RMJ14_02790 [Nitrososphaerota archaeon]|nr:hypothetical protein [Aigarchaeota archaeon]MDW8076548.1 hypothetical protein [Nitrososphaerota archaeon]